MQWYGNIIAYSMKHNLNKPVYNSYDTKNYKNNKCTLYT